MSFADRSVVLFDLDGTLADSAHGILAALRRAVADEGLPALSADQERRVLGPPMYESLPRFLPPQRVPDVIAAYRRHYGAGGMFDTAAFPGVGALLEHLQLAGRRSAVATSKAETFAVPIVAKIGLDEWVVTVGGDDFDGSRPTKADVITHVLDRLGGVAPGEVVMVGDRRYDVEGARALGIDCIGVAWGYALPGELEAAQPAALAGDVAELAALLGVGRDD